MQTFPFLVVHLQEERLQRKNEATFKILPSPFLFFFSFFPPFHLLLQVNLKIQFFCLFVCLFAVSRSIASTASHKLTYQVTLNTAHEEGNISEGIYHSSLFFFPQSHSSILTRSVSKRKDQRCIFPSLLYSCWNKYLSVKQLLQLKQRSHNSCVLGQSKTTQCLIFILANDQKMFGYCVCFQETFRKDCS